MVLFIILLLVKIFALYAAVCGLIFIYRKLFTSASSTNKSALDLFIESCLREENNFSSDRKKNSNSPCTINNDIKLNRVDEQPVRYTKLSKLFLYAFMPIWLTIFLAEKTFSNFFSWGKSLYYPAFTIKNRMAASKKSIDAQHTLVSKLLPAIFILLAEWVCYQPGGVVLSTNHLSSTANCNLPGLNAKTFVKDSFFVTN